MFQTICPHQLRPRGRADVVSANYQIVNINHSWTYNTHIQNFIKSIHQIGGANICIPFKNPSNLQSSACYLQRVNMIAPSPTQYLLRKTTPFSKIFFQYNINTILNHPLKFGIFAFSLFKPPCNILLIKEISSEGGHKAAMSSRYSLTQYRLRQLFNS